VTVTVGVMDEPVCGVLMMTVMVGVGSPLAGAWVVIEVVMPVYGW
jgi:hypothetical protein